VLPSWQTPSVPKVAVQENRLARSGVRNIRFADYAIIMGFKMYASLFQFQKDLFFKSGIHRPDSAHRSASLFFCQSVHNYYLLRNNFNSFLNVL
jgi:hypothetical protein